MAEHEPRDPAVPRPVRAAGEPIPARTETFDPGPSPETPGPRHPAPPPDGVVPGFDPCASPEFASRFSIEKILGRGGMGIVYGGVHKSLGRPVAIKFVLGVKPRLLARFKREKTLISRLSHPNVVELLDTGEVQGLPYLVMELVTGGTLNDLLSKSGGRLPMARAIPIMTQLLDGLHHVHNLGIVHRDLKPANVFHSERGEVKIADFGLAWAADAESLTGSEEAMGTPPYMPPEQFEGPVEEPTADIYSVGVIFFEMLTGRLPLVEASFGAYLAAHRSDRRPPPARNFDPSIPPAVEALLRSSLDKKPAARPRTTKHFRHLLQAALIGTPHESLAGATARTVDGVPLTTAPADQPGPQAPTGPLPLVTPPEIQEHAPRTLGGLDMLAAAVLVGGLLLGSWALHHRRATTPRWPDPPVTHAYAY